VVLFPHNPDITDALLLVQRRRRDTRIERASIGTMVGETGMEKRGIATGGCIGSGKIIFYTK